MVGGFPFAPGLQHWAPPEVQRQNRVPLPAEVETADRGLAQTLLETGEDRYVCSERNASVERTGGPEPHTEGSKSVDSESSEIGCGVSTVSGQHKLREEGKLYPIERRGGMRRHVSIAEGGPE